jgi:hypothetical protein
MRGFSHCRVRRRKPLSKPVVKDQKATLLEVLFIEGLYFGFQNISGRFRL